MPSVASGARASAPTPQGQSNTPAATPALPDEAVRDTVQRDVEQSNKLETLREGRGNVPVAATEGGQAVQSDRVRTPAPQKVQESAPSPECEVMEVVEVEPAAQPAPPLEGTACAGAAPPAAAAAAAAAAAPVALAAPAPAATGGAVDAQLMKGYSRLLNMCVTVKQRAQQPGLSEDQRTAEQELYSDLMQQLQDVGARLGL